VAWDLARRLPGRGAYLHLENECFERFARRKPFLRALRAAVGTEERRRLVTDARSFSAS
jgi:predicted RNA-binding protein YlxR (DUF448 family)